MSIMDIQFRGKCKKTNEFVYGYLFYTAKKPLIKEKYTSNTFNIITSTEGQYIGATDRNSFRIYDKQHLIWHQKNGKSIELIVEWMKNKFCWVFRSINDEKIYFIDDFEMTETVGAVHLENIDIKPGT